MSNNFLDKDGAVVGPVDFNLTLGRKAAAAVRSFSLCTDDSANLATIATNAASTAPSPVELGPFSPVYITSGTNAAVQIATAAVGDYLQHFILQPTTTSPGAFTLYDGSTSGTNSIKYTHPGGASSLTNLAPIILGITANCVNAGWHITIISGWTVTLVGKFS